MHLKKTTSNLKDFDIYKNSSISIVLIHDQIVLNFFAIKADMNSCKHVVAILVTIAPQLSLGLFIISYSSGIFFSEFVFFSLNLSV